MKWEEKLEIQVEALGINPNDFQKERLVSWIINYVPRDYWRNAAYIAMQVPGVYTEISMRCGECSI